MLDRLPGWVVDDDASVRAEVAEWRDLTPAERWRLAVLCSRDVMWAARASGQPARTADVDVNVFVGDERLDDVLAALRGLGIEADDAEGAQPLT